MTGAAWLAILVAVVAAPVDWWAVARERLETEYVAKPLVLVALIAAAAALTPGDAAVRTAVVVGLTLGLIGDVLLMLDRFIPGAAAFLLGHLAYLVAFLLVPQKGPFLFAGAIIIGILLGLVARPVVAGARRRSTTLTVVIVAYLIVLGAVVVFGFGTGNPWLMAGVLLFAVSDALLAYGRFVGSAPGGRVAVHVTYHLAQLLIVLSLPTLV